MFKIALKACQVFCGWCETYRRGCSFSETRFGRWLYRNALDLETYLGRKS